MNEIIDAFTTAVFVVAYMLTLYCNTLAVYLGAEIRSVCTEAGMFAIRERRKVKLFVKLYFVGIFNIMDICFLVVLSLYYVRVMEHHSVG